MDEDVRAAAAGDRRAFTRLVERHRGAVCAVALGITGDVVTSEDVAQDVFVRAWRSLGALKDPDAFRGWILESARNRARDLVRARIARGVPAPASVLADIADPGPSVTDRMAEREDALRIEASLAALAEGDREVLVLYYREGERLAAVAGQLGIGEEAARQRLSRARKRLQVDVEQRLAQSLARTSPGAVFVGRVQLALPAGPPGVGGAAGGGAATAWIAGAVLVVAVIAVVVLVDPRAEREVPVAMGTATATATPAEMRVDSTLVSTTTAPKEIESETASGDRARNGGSDVAMTSVPQAIAGEPGIEIRAVVRFAGYALAAKKIKKTPECGSDLLVDEVVATREGLLENVLVRVIEGAPEVAGKGQGVEITQDKCVYSPRVSGIVAGQSIAVTSRDNFLHNVHTFKGDVSIFNKGQPAPSTFVKEAVDFAVGGEMVRSGAITFKCDVHPWMIAHVVVNPNPYFGVTNEAGVATFSVPAGTYLLEAWHEKFGRKTAELDTRNPVVLFEYVGNEEQR